MRFALLFFFVLIGQLAFAQKPLTKETLPTLFSLTAVDEQTTAELPAKFTVRGVFARKKWEGSTQPGKGFDLTLKQTDTLYVVATSPGYYESELVMLVDCDTCSAKGYGYAVQLEKKSPKADSVFRDLAVNQAFRLDNVYFDQSSYVLRAQSFPQLDKLAKTLQTTPGLKIEIAGHTDNVGDRRLNQALSENRAKIITSYLVRHGIAEDRLRFAGYGDTRPAAPNDSEENKRQNRRVEFVVLAL